MRLPALFLLLLTPLCAQWKAGVARTDITPDSPIWLGGYGSRTKPSEGVRQRIYVKALALREPSGETSVLVTSDILGFNAAMAATVAKQVEAKYKIPRSRLALNSSHTHSAPVTDTVLRPAYPYEDSYQPVIQKYTRKLLDQVVATIGAAIQDLAPATLSFEQGLAGFAVNRRRSGRRNLPGPVDHDVPVLKVAGADGKLRAIVFGYACHATTLSDYQVNGDWPGYAQEELERAHPGAAALFVTGAGADANPLPRRTEELAKIYGKVLAAAVNEVLAGKMKPVEGKLRAAFETVDLPFQKPPTRQELQARLNSDFATASHARYLLKMLDQNGKLPERYAYPVQVWRFGNDLTWILLGGELVVDYSLRLKAIYGWDNTWVSGYSNDVMTYIPSLRVLKEGGYEGGGAMVPYGLPGPFRAPVEEIIVEKVGELAEATSNPTAVRSFDKGPIPGSSLIASSRSQHLAHTAQQFANGQGDAREQAEQALANLDRVLQRAGTNLTQAVKLNVYVTDPASSGAVGAALEKRFAGQGHRPAVSLVAGKLAKPGALVAVDAVAPTRTLIARTTEVAVLPAGSRVYISGQAEKGSDPRSATTATLKRLQSNLEFAGAQIGDVVQVKVFLQPMSAAAQVADAANAFFGPGGPPVVIVDWVSNAPVEIELIARTAPAPGRTLEYLTPPEEKRPRVYTRIVRVHHPETLYTSGLYGEAHAKAGDQIRQMFALLKRGLDQAGGDLRHLAKATYYVSDDESSKLLNDLRPEYFEDGRAPAASKAFTPGSGLAGRPITMDMIAVPKD